MGMAGLVVAGLLGYLGWDRYKAATDPYYWRDRAEAAGERKDFRGARDAWARFNATPRASGRTLLSEARAGFAMNRAAEADRVLGRAIDLDPTDAGPWILRLELLRVEGRTLEAMAEGARAWRSVPATGRKELLRAWTLAVLAEPPADRARASLVRWADADPGDLDATVALWNRMADDGLDGDLDRASRVAKLEEMLRPHPDHIFAREALATAYADSGEPELGRKVLDAWPESGRDARYWRLLGRWELDFDRSPARAVESLGRALADWPHDWKARYRLARALKALGREEESRRQADAVASLRERLDPARLGARLAADLDRIDDPRALYDLSDLCRQLGLDALADAWRDEARRAGPNDPSVKH